MRTVQFAFEVPPEVFETPDAAVSAARESVFNAATNVYNSLAYRHASSDESEEGVRLTLVYDVGIDRSGLTVSDPQKDDIDALHATALNVMRERLANHHLDSARQLS